MPRSTRNFVLTALTIGLAIVGATAFGIAAAQSSHEQAKPITHRIMASATEFRIGDHQQLRKLFLSGDRLR